MDKIAWLDSTGEPSRIHLTSDGIDTTCGGHSEYIAERVLYKSPKYKHGRSNHCRVCFENGGKGNNWDKRCVGYEG